MNRRGLLKLFGGVVAGVALEQAIPFGRVWSFPKQIALANVGVDYGFGDSFSAATVPIAFCNLPLARPLLEPRGGGAVPIEWTKLVVQPAYPGFYLGRLFRP